VIYELDSELGQFKISDSDESVRVSTDDISDDDANICTVF